MKTYKWTNAAKVTIKSVEQVTEEREETFSLEDLAQEWKNRKAALETAKAEIVAFRKKVTDLCKALKIAKKDLIELDDLKG